MTEFKMYKNGPRPDESNPAFILRMLRNRKNATTPCTQAQYDWLVANNIAHRFDNRKDDEYLVIENDNDAIVFRLKFNV